MTLYHNRGDSTFNGESDTFGDFFGLDDLFTEHPRVVEGMIDLYGDLIERYDDRRLPHRHDEARQPRVLGRVRAGDPRRAADARPAGLLHVRRGVLHDPILQSSFTNLGVSATLDFIVNDAVKRYAGGGIGRDLVDELDDDDWFTDADNNASMQVTFVGNHDEGRLGYFLERAEPGADEARLLERCPARLRPALPAARCAGRLLRRRAGVHRSTAAISSPARTCSRRQTPEYLDDDNIGSDVTPAADNFDPEHPLYRHIAQLAALRRDHPTLVTGAQVNHTTEGSVVAFSRLDRDELVEYVVVSNSDGEQSVPVRFPVLTPDTSFTAVYADGEVERWSDRRSGARRRRRR